MKVVILFFTIFCVTIYSTYGQIPSEDEISCAYEEYIEPCFSKHCKELERIENSEPDFKRDLKHCCPISRCAKCVEDIGPAKCGPTTQSKFQEVVADFNTLFADKGCTESEKYPSTKCLYYFYTVWFYVVPLVILAAIGGVVAFVVIRRRQSSTVTHF